MDSASSQGFLSDEGERCSPIRCFDHNDFSDDELLRSMELSILEGGNMTQESLGELASLDNIVEPDIGKEFSSRDEARDFYVAYGRSIGFTVRIHHNRRSRINNMVIGQDFVCSKEGFREKKYVARKDRVLPPPPITREGCQAMIRVALKDGIWVVTKFVKDHNHVLMSPSEVPWRGSAKNLISEDEKDQRIRELSLELYNERQKCKRRCAAYQEQLQVLLKFVEDHADHLSRSVEDIVNRIKDLEDDQPDGSD